jgi:hypothetical protein
MGPLAAKGQQMKIRIGMIKEALAIAHKQLADLKAICPKHLLEHKEVAELEMGLDWTQKRADALDEIISDGHPPTKPTKAL